MHSVKGKIHQNLISGTIVRSPWSLRICICVCICICLCICICVLLFVYLCLHLHCNLFTLSLPTRTSFRTSCEPPHAHFHSSKIPLVSALTRSLEHVHECVRPRNLRWGCGGEAPKKLLTPLIFMRLYTRSRLCGIRPFFKSGGSTPGLKLSIYMLDQGLILGDLARSCQFNLGTVKVMDSPATPF